MEEGLFPHIRSMQSAEEIEEERRLFYVAMTRAREKLTLSWSQKRGMFGNTMSNRPSRFLEEIPSWFKVARVSERFSAPAFRSSAPAAVTGRQEPPETARCEFPVGSVVRHDTLGQGTVLAIEGVPNDWKLTIRFADGVKKILTRYARLQRER
jgi:DNA helicase-2/ATP-dependent DNA helicase PcrA